MWTHCCDRFERCCPIVHIENVLVATRPTTGTTSGRGVDVEGVPWGYITFVVVLVLWSFVSTLLAVLLCFARNMGASLERG